MKTKTAAARHLFSCVLVGAVTALQAATYYVAPSGSDTATGTNAVTPFATIQRGVNAAVAGDTVLVSPGIYTNAPLTTAPASGYSRVVITKNITVRSTQGAEQTIIRGQPHTAIAPYGSNSVRCVYMTAGTLDGFTLQNGFANASASGSNMDDPVKNGGGVYTSVSNRVPQVNNCIITACGAYRGGGAYWVTLNNCTVVSNSIYTTSGAGVFSCDVRNSIVMFNGTANNSNYSSEENSVDQSLFTHSCTDPEPGVNYFNETRDGGGNVSSDPEFVAGSYRLSDASPCINAGTNAYAYGLIDAQGGVRIQGGIVDMGAYERSSLYNTLTVINGTGSGTYSNGATVVIQAQATNTWAYFSGWAGDIATVADTMATNTTLTMPNNNISVTATFDVLSLSDYLSEILDLPLPVVSGNVAFDDIDAQTPEVQLGGVGKISDNETAFISTVYTNAGTVIFPWRVSCEQNWDRFVFSVDGVERAVLTGFASGVVTQFIAGAGAHELKWAYIKDDSAFDGEDCGWLKPVTWIPDDLAAELGAAGKPLAFPYGQPGDVLPFPYGFQACFLDHAAPGNAVGDPAVRLGGLDNGSPLVADNETTGVEAVLYGAGVLSFRWYSSCQDTDYVKCFIDGVEAGRLSGLSSKSGGWKTFTTNLLTVGTHTVRWAYVKNAANFTGQDCGWIDNVSWAQFSYNLIVENGVIVSTGQTNGTFAVGDTVAIVAIPAASGMAFDQWDGDTENLSDAGATNTTVTMPGRDITVRALYKVKTLSVAVINGRDAGAWPNAVHAGTGEPEGTYPAGALVRIVADPAPLWQTFDHWTNTMDDVVYSNRFADISEFVMPNHDVLITAVYRDQTAAERLATALTIRGQPLQISQFSTNGVVAEATGGIRYNDTVVRMGGPSVAPGQSVFLSTTNFTGSGYLLFWWHGDAEAEQDGVRLEVNGVTLDPLMSDKGTNSLVATWNLYGYDLRGLNVTNITWRYTNDFDYVVHENEVLLDRATWIPEAMAQALDVSWFPNVNNEFDPLFEGRLHSSGDFDFEGEDGGVVWVHDAPGGGDAIRLGAFGYVTNNQLAQVSVTNWGTGILEWDWTTSSEARYDRLEFLLNGNPTNWTSGKSEGVWSNALFVASTDPTISREENRALKRILTYRYRKDGDVSVFKDCGWLRNAHWTPTFALQLVEAATEHYELQAPYTNNPSRYAAVFSDAGRNVFPSNSQVTVTANPVPEAFDHFERWTGNGATLLASDQLRNSTVTFFMPTNDVMLIATYTTNTITLPLYYLTVNNGAGSGSFTNGSAVHIQANTPAVGKIFTGWAGTGTNYVVDLFSASTAVIMGTEDIEVHATYSTSLWTLESALSFVLGVPDVSNWANIAVDDLNQDPPSVRLGSIGNNETAFFECVYTNAGTVIFPWSVSSERDYDILSFSVDGTNVASISGEASGTITNYVAGDGCLHSLRWTYSKDDSAIAGTDSGSVGAITWIPDALAAEFGVRGRQLYFPNTLNSIMLESPVAGAISNAAVRFGGPMRVVNGAEASVEALYVGAGVLSFHWRTSSELDHDFLILSVDGVETERISGTRDAGWSYFETNLITVASHVVRWTYRKDGAKTAGDDCGWVDSVSWAQFHNTLTIENGVIETTGQTNGSFVVGDTVAISANAAPLGQVFDSWDGDTETLSDLHAATTTLTMQGRDMMLRALYKVKTLRVAVINGSDAGAWPNAAYESSGEPEGEYPSGALVRIVASPAPLWQTFDHWTASSSVVFSNTLSEITMFVMPTNDVTVTAVFRPQSTAETLAGALTVRGQPLVITSYSTNGVSAEATGGIRYDDPVVKLGGPSVGPNQSVSLSTTNFTGNGCLLFWWRADAESEQDGLQLEANGIVRSPVYSEKVTNTSDTVVWYLYGFRLNATTNITWRFVRDDTYYIHDNMVLLDRVTWIPEGLINELDAGACFPNINAEYDPLFQGRNHAGGEFDFEGEDGGVAWVHDAPGGGDAVRLGRFGYVTNNLCAQVAFTNYNTGILTWEWTANSEAACDMLGLYVDGVKTNWISGKGDGTWYSTAFIVTSDLLQNNMGKTIFNFRYQKDGDVSMFNDCAWVRNVRWSPFHELVVNDGTIVTPSIGDEGFYAANTPVTLLADAAQEGSYFDRWTGTDVSPLGASVTDPNPTFLMPAYDLTLTATYTTNAPAIPHYALTVVNGSGSGSYTNGATVAINAFSPTQWSTFLEWTGDIAAVANPSNASTTVLIGTNDLMVTASYASIAVEELIPLVIGVPDPVTAGNLTAANISATPPTVMLGPVGDNQAAFFETVYTNAGTVIFPWTVDSEENYDFLVFSVDGTPKAAFSGVQSGVMTNFVTGDGPHTLKWSYEKDISDSAGSDKATVGRVTWIPDALAVELGAPGRTPYAPDGFDAVLLDYAPPAGAISNLAVRLGGPGAVADSGSVTLGAVFYGSGTLAFHWRTSSEQSHDFLILKIDGQETARISGTKDGWLLFETNLLTVANHTVQWVYSKNASNTAGSDCGWIDSVTWDQFEYPLIVENGTGDGTYAVGDTVTIIADAAPDGQEFDTWDGDTETIADVLSPTNSLVMPGRAITVRALFRQKRLTVTVINGRDAGAWPNAYHESTGEPEGEYPFGALVRIVANTAPLWQTFDHWTQSGGAVFSNAYDPVSLFSMPSNSVVVTALYRNQTDNEKLAGALTIAGQQMNVTSFSSNGVVAEATGGVRYSDPVVKFGGPSVGAGQSVSLTITNFTGDGVLLFWWKAQAEAYSDTIEIYANGSSYVGSIVSGKGSDWKLSTNLVSGATSLTFKFVRDGSYYVRDNVILVDRVTWIPVALMQATGFSQCIPNINEEATGFSGEDGGVAWVNDTPDSSYAIRLGRFGYVNNNQHAQLSVTNSGTGILLWQWATCSEAGYDGIDFFLDGGERKRWLSVKEPTSWFSANFVITNLPSLTRVQNRNLNHEFLFKYSKDADVSVYNDCAWLKNGTWTPTFKVDLSYALVTNYTLLPPFNTIAEANEEALNSVFPAGTLVKIQADAPPLGQYFDSWAGHTSVLSGSDVTNASPTFVMPASDIALMATYTTNAPSGSPSAPALFEQPTSITGFALQSSLSPELAPLSTVTPAKLVVLAFEGVSQTDYELQWCPALSSDEGVWESVPVFYREVMGDSLSGSRQIRIYAEVPADTKQGFFRVRPR